jgi:hypothetical protein
VKRTCAWCRKDLKAKEEYAFTGEISHGACSKCALDLTKNAPRTAADILSLIKEPIFVVGANRMIRAANRSGAELLGKGLPDIEDHLGGDAFECTYARLEGGCGNTEHCKTCAIRNTVMDTLTTGRGHVTVPAYQSINTPDGARVLMFLISTEKAGDQVLLRIDSVGRTTIA